MRCTGPYTRVFLDAKDARQCRDLIAALEGAGLEVPRRQVPEGKGRTDDFVFEIGLALPDAPDAPWTIGLARFLGPKKLLRQGRVYELTVKRADGWEGHLFAPALPALLDRFQALWPRLAAGETDIEDLIPKAEAHEERILLCHG